jgi:hypothetical protein
MGFYDWINMAFPTFVPDTHRGTGKKMGSKDVKFQLPSGKLT